MVGENNEELSEASKVPLEHIFNNHDNCNAKLCFKKRSSEEGNTYNETDDKLYCKQNNNQLYSLPKMTIFTFQTDKVLKEPLYMFDTQKNESMNNVIA